MWSSKGKTYLRSLTKLVALVALSGPLARAQFSSAIEGTATDQSGAAIPNARITVVNEETNVPYTTESNGSGVFRVSTLSEGTYRVDVQATGFVPWAQRNLRLQANEVRTIYPNLRLGEQKTSVQVEATPEAIETGKSETSREIEARTITEAPIFGRNVYTGLATLAPGITGTGAAGAGTPTLGTDNFGTELQPQINAAGQRVENNQYELDGSNIVVVSRGGAVYVSPEPDTVESMKISAAEFSAERGRSSGASIQTFTKAGTNQFHGALSEFHTNNHLQARTEFQSAIPVFRRNEFGGTFGGPIIKNRTFFFGGIFGLRASTGQTQIATIETPEFRSFVHSTFPNSIADTFFQQSPAAADPVTNIINVGQLEVLNPGHYSAAAFPANLAAVGTAVIGQSLPRDGNQWHLRLDHNFANDKDRLFFSVFRTDGNQLGADPRPNQRSGTAETGLFTKLNWIRAIRPTLINEASTTYVRTTGDNPIPLPNLPTAYISGVSAFGTWGPGSWAENNFNWHDVLSWTVGKHTLQMGVDVDRQRDDDPFSAAYGRPSFNFANLLDFAQDLPFSQSGPTVNGTNGQLATVNMRQRVFYLASFLQDDIKLTSRFTLNVGLRYEYFGHLATVKDDATSIPKFTPGPGATFAEQLATGSMQLRGKDKSYQTLGILQGTSPRVGFGWDVFGNGSTAIRGGYGVFYNKLGNLAYRSEVNPPVTVTPFASVLEGSSFSYRVGPNFVPPPGFSVNINRAGGIVGSTVQAQGLDPYLDPPRTQSWMLSVQRLLWKDIALEADYNGTHSDRLYTLTDVNRFAGDLVQNGGQLTRLNPYFGPILYGRSIGVSDGHYGTLMLSRRFSQHWSARGIFAFGKATDFDSSSNQGPPNAQSVVNALNVAAQKGRADFSVARRVAVDSVIEVPVLWKNGLAGEVLKGWRLTTIAILQSGLPFSVYTSAPFPSGDYNADGFNYDYPNAPIFGKSFGTGRQEWLNGVFQSSNFPRPQPGQPGSLGRNVFTGPGLANVNLNASKAFRIPWFYGEGASLEFRGELFNIFNRVNLANPVSDLSSGLFGRSVSQSLPRAVQFGLHFSF